MIALRGYSVNLGGKDGRALGAGLKTLAVRYVLSPLS
jgi:hypothetical protein